LHKKSANNRIKTDAGKLAEALRGKVIGRRGLCEALGFAIVQIFPKDLHPCLILRTKTHIESVKLTVFARINGKSLRINP
jgi:hypothetical protein